MKYVALIPSNGDLQWQVAAIGGRFEARQQAKENNPGALVNVLSLTYVKRHWPDVWANYELHLKAEKMQKS